MYTASPKRKGKCGSKVIINQDNFLEELQQIPQELRQSIRSTAAAMGVGPTTIHRMLKIAEIQKFRSPLKPILSEPAKYKRVLYAVSRISPNDDGTYGDFYKASYDDVHVDEKWFDITKTVATFYTVRGERVPTRRVQSKSHIIKVMFLVAVARPRYDNNHRLLFDGKIGCWPFVEQVVAQRTTQNRPAGTIIIRNKNVNKPLYTEFVLQKLLPAIREKWPRGNVQEMRNVNLQHDNSPVHFKKTDPEWLQATQEYRLRHRLNLSIHEQPAQSPDCNILDLGFFASIQSIQHRQPPATTIDGLIANVFSAWQQYNPLLLNRTFLTHQAVTDLIIQNVGDNDFKLPHLAKEAQERHDNLPTILPVSDEAKAIMLRLEIARVEPQDQE